MAAGIVKEVPSIFKTQNAFVWAFLIGLVLISLTKLIGQEQPIWGGIVASALGIGVMWFYQREQKTSRPETDQPRLGDEVYYIGLLYTLTSLCAALVILFLMDSSTRSLDDRTDEMIGSFGIALLTTMAGIVMRMTLQRHGEEEHETVIRISSDMKGVTVDLERHAYELRRQLQNSTNAFASHTNSTILQAKTIHSHMDEMIKTFHEGLEQKAKAELESLCTIYRAVGEKKEEEEKIASVQRLGIQNLFKKLETQISDLDESIEQIRINSEETARNLGTIATQAQVSADVFAKSEQTVAESLNVLVEAKDAENAYRVAQTHHSDELIKMITKQTQGWAELRLQASEALEEMKQANYTLTRLGNEAERTSDKLASLPDGVHNARAALDELTEITETRNAIVGLGTNAKEVVTQFTRSVEALKHQQESIGDSAAKLSGLSEATAREIVIRNNLNESIAEMSDVIALAGSYSEKMKETERTIQNINMEFDNVRSKLQNGGERLSEVLNEAVSAFEEARSRADRSKGTFWPFR